MDGDPDGPGLIGDGAGDGLSDPPGSVGAEFIATAILKFIHRLHEPDIALLDEIEKLQAAVGIFLGDAHH
jgi:hypothetical protein